MCKICPIYKYLCLSILRVTQHSLVYPPNVQYLQPSVTFNTLLNINYSFA